MRPHLRYSSNRLISALPLVEHRPARSRTRPSTLRGSRLFLGLLDMVHEGSGSSGTQGRRPPLGLGIRGRNAKSRKPNPMRAEPKVRIRLPPAEPHLLLWQRYRVPFLTAELAGGAIVSAMIEKTALLNFDTVQLDITRALNSVGDDPETRLPPPVP